MNIDSQLYYLLIQIGASLLIAFVAADIGLIIAWLIWGRKKWKIVQAEKRIAELNALLDGKSG